MHSGSCFRTSFSSQCVDGFQTLQKYAEANLYPTFPYNTVDKSGKRPFLTYLISQDCVSNHCLPMLGILAIIRGIYRNQLKCIYLKNINIFGKLLLRF